jgi:hypothetical protein
MEPFCFKCKFFRSTEYGDADPEIGLCLNKKNLPYTPSGELIMDIHDNCKNFKAKELL